MSDKENKAKISLKGVKVVFSNLKDDGFGRSITINADDSEVKKKIEAWVKYNKIGKSKPGVANFKDYEGKLQYNFRINDHTRFGGLNGLTVDDLGYGATISLIAKAFEYDNKFGKGVSSSLSAVVIERANNTSADDDLTELLAGEEGGNFEKFVEDKEKLKAKGDVVLEDIDDKPIDLSEIPF